MSIHTCKLNNILYLCHRKQDYPMCMRVLHLIQESAQINATE